MKGLVDMPRICPAERLFSSPEVGRNPTEPLPKTPVALIDRASWLGSWFSDFEIRIISGDDVATSLTSPRARGEVWPPGSMSLSLIRATLARRIG
jgi:hypothetical protein